MTPEEAIESMDARALRLREHLLPPGTILVRDDEETRERIGAALRHYVARGMKWTDCTDAVIAALRERGAK